MMKKSPLRTVSVALLSLLVLLICGASVWLWPLSPKQVDSPISGVRVGHPPDYLLISGHDLACQEPGPTGAERCRMSLEGELLAMRVTYINPAGTSLGPSSCAATYGGRPVACWATYTLVNRNPFVVIEDNLGLSPERLRQWRNRDVLLHLPEADWIKGANMLAVLVTLNVVVLLWQPTRRYIEAYSRGSNRWPALLRALGCLAGGYLAFRIVQWVLLLNLLFLGFVD